MLFMSRVEIPHEAGIMACTAGSIGTQTLDIVKEHSDRFEVVALAAGSNVALLAEQVTYQICICAS